MPVTKSPTRWSGEENRQRSAHFACPRCDGETAVLIADGPHSASPPRCACGLDLAGGAPPPPHGEPLQACWVCGCEDLYAQKDFNRLLGFAVVSVSFFVVFLVMLVVEHRAGIALLIVLAAADAFAYRLLPTVTVCYLCQSVYRGFPAGASRGGFYLGLEEKYKQLRVGWAESQVSRVP